MSGPPAKKAAAFLAAGALLAAVFFWAVNTGGLRTTPLRLFRGLFLAYDETVAVILQLRFPRIMAAMLGGALMAASGVCMQAVTQNPLADPGIVGVSAGAALGAVIVSSFFPAAAALTPLFAFAGGCGAFLAVCLLARGREISPLRLILTGIAADAFFTGLYQAADAFAGSPYTGAARILSAGISLKTWGDVRTLLCCAVPCGILCALAARGCDLLALSDRTVLALGVSVTRLRVLVSLLSVLMASIFTAVIGRVSFLGLVVPHLARLLVGSGHRVLLPYSALLGALVFLFADTAGRGAAYPYEIPASVVMTIIGGPALAVLLKRSGGAYGT